MIELNVIQRSINRSVLTYSVILLAILLIEGIQYKSWQDQAVATTPLHDALMQIGMGVESVHSTLQELEENVHN